MLATVVEAAAAVVAAAGAAVPAHNAGVAVAFDDETPIFMPSSAVTMRRLEMLIARLMAELGRAPGSIAIMNAQNASRIRCFSVVVCELFVQVYRPPRISQCPYLI